ncbi:HpcH/HpaI aldolase family protein [Aestuariicoccus sp. MJ-SS9]|uniref:HpcH/HpaI aldolase family protein n=1 Tax=Aestuariicoccus sp. MJ-SS9 TaxID=3079855 RepID=UPI00290EE486|nr:aldolase/citrate lyase family protein [Aestuariicoccus sp. MJ-SS9]MDU8913789.1 aldolase/citrate lyase family protein [Aestuariicoccus sp. MJ-SS9]
MRITGFRDRMLSGTPLAGTFLKTPAFQLIEVLAQSELDFVCLDAEHAPFDRAAMDACLAIGRALDFPVLVRVGDASARETLWALDAGAVGVVVPHVDSVEKARAVARAARFGHGGRGFAGSTRWAGYATRGMGDVLAQSSTETVLIAQIEEPEAVEVAEEIAAVDGIDGLFLGPADLSVGYGFDHQNSPQLESALRLVGEACRAQGKTYVTFVPNAEKAAEWAKYGLTMFFIASEHTWMRAGATAQARGIHELGSD